MRLCIAGPFNLFHTYNKILDYEIVLSAHNLLESYIISHIAGLVNERQTLFQDAVIWFTAVLFEYTRMLVWMQAEKLICCWQMAHQIE